MNAAICDLNQTSPPDTDSQHFSDVYGPINVVLLMCTQSPQQRTNFRITDVTYYQQNLNRSRFGPECWTMGNDKQSVVML